MIYSLHYSMCALDYKYYMRIYLYSVDLEYLL